MASPPLAVPDRPTFGGYRPPVYPPRPAFAPPPTSPSSIYGPSVGRTNKTVAPLGSLVIADDLQYNAGGPLAGQNGGTGWDASWIRHGWASPSQVMAGGLVYPDLPAGKTLFRTGTGNQGDDRWFVHPLGTPGEVIYLSQTLRGLPDSASAWNRSGFGYRVDDGDNNSMTGVAFGKFEWDPHIIIRAAPAHEFAPTGIIAQQNTTYFLVARITFGATDSKVDLWVDPVPGRPLPTNPDATMTLRFNRISRYSALSEIPCDFGPIRIGSTYASVAPKSSTVTTKP